MNNPLYNVLNFKGFRNQTLFKSKYETNYITATIKIIALNSIVLNNEHITLDNDHIFVDNNNKIIDNDHLIVENDHNIVDNQPLFVLIPCVHISTSVLLLKTSSNNLFSVFPLLSMTMTSSSSSSSSCTWQICLLTSRTTVTRYTTSMH